MTRRAIRFLATALVCAATAAVDARARGAGDDFRLPPEFEDFRAGGDITAYLEPASRPLRLIEAMSDGPLRRRLAACGLHRFRSSDFSIGHRGAPRRFAEHTRESYIAAARQGAGVIECDVTFTRDRELVCRHSQCDLHSTTNILEIPELAAKCSQPFQPYDPGILDRLTGHAGVATARCCTSDITLAEFKTLRGRMDRVNPRAKTVDEYLHGGAAADSGGTLMTHAESIRLFQVLGVKMIPELKAPAVGMPYQGEFTRQMYAQKMIDEYRQAGVDPSQLMLQSFSLEDLDYWIANEPAYAGQAVYLDSRMYRQPGFRPTREDFESLARRGLRIVAPPMFALLTLGPDGEIMPSDYARLARAAGLDIITWTFERSNLQAGARADDFYYSSIAGAVGREGDGYLALDVLAREVKIRGIFSDWPATVTYYANCTGLD